MAGECISDLGVISMHYNERISVNDVCLAFTLTHTRRLFKPSLMMTEITIFND